MLEHLEHMGIRWGYVFLRSANHLRPEQFPGAYDAGLSRCTWRERRNEK